ncbi:MAG: acyl-CoA thioesterase [Bacteroidales bacterium]|nr:acyl-CoA thioesterase [Bacteroidales bacterium]
MFNSETQLRVRYAETDQMGYVYYGNYAQYLEIGRVEAMRELKTSYRAMEESGVIMPVLSMNIKYIRPAYYDDLLTIRTIIQDIPKTRIHFDYEIYNSDKELLSKASTVLVFVDKQSMRPVEAPAWFIKKLEKRLR